MVDTYPHDEYEPMDADDNLGFEPPEEELPAEWWEQALADHPKAEQLERAVDALILLGCRKADLLLELQRVRGRYEVLRSGGKALPKQLQLVTDVLNHAMVTATTELQFAIGYSSEEWERFFDVTADFQQRLAASANTLTNNPNGHRREAVGAFLALVRRETGEPHFQLVSQLLRGFIDRTLTESALRKIASRLGQARRTKPKEFKERRRSSLKGRPAGLSDRTRVQRLAHRRKLLG